MAKRGSYFERFAVGGPGRLDEIVALQRGVVGRAIHLIASACYPFDSVIHAMAEPAFVLPAEGMPGERYLPGAAVMDQVEIEGEQLALGLFGSPDGYRASLQPHSGTQANQIVFNATLRPDDTVLNLRPPDGGHVSHSVLISRRHRTISYPVTADGRLDYNELRSLALQHRPRLIIVGGSSLPRSIDLESCAEIAKESGAWLHGDLSHTATFVASGHHPDAFPHCDFVTFNTVKNLRGPNAGVLVYRSEFDRLVESAIFPVTQGGANETGMLGKFACLSEWAARDLHTYAQGIIDRATAMADRFRANGFELVADGTDCHLVIIDLRTEEVSGATVERRLEMAGVLANRNLVPGDRRSPQQTSGLRMGSTNLAILGYDTDDIHCLADLVSSAVRGDVTDGDVVHRLAEKYQSHLVAPDW